MGQGYDPGEAEGAQVELEFELGADPIRGTIREGGGDASPFCGWIELIGALERASSAERPPEARGRGGGGAPAA